MQKRTSIIKSFFDKLKKSLNKEIKLEDLYFAALNLILKKKEIKINSLSKQRPYMRKAELIENLKIHKPAPPKVIIRRNELIKEIWTSSNLIDEIPAVRIKSALNFDYKVKWVVLNMESLLVKRQYEVDLSSQFQANKFNEFDLLKNFQINSVDKSELKLPDKAFVVEEILKFIPYKNQLPIDLVYKIPMEKEEAIITEFSMDRIEEFKNILASTAKTSLFNIEILSIYANFYPNLYSMIRRDNRNKKLLCFLDRKKTKSKEGKKYYFIMGKRIDNKKTYTSLVEC